MPWFCLLRREQRDPRRQARVGFEEFLHKSKRRFVFLFCVRHGAIRGHKQIEVAHVGIVCCEKHAKIPSNACQD